MNTSSENKGSAKQKESRDREALVGSVAIDLGFELDENAGQDKLRQLDYFYNRLGQMRHIETGEPFKYTNEPHYVEIGNGMEEFVQFVMKDRFRYTERKLPTEVPEDYPEECHDDIKTNIFTSPDFETKSTLCLVIQGSGGVRAGQWARSVCINDCLAVGAIFPFLAEAEARDWGVIVFNPNKNNASIHPDGYEKAMKVPIPDNNTPEKHCEYVYNKFVVDAACENIVIIAHSFGGCCTVHLLNECHEHLLPLLRGIAFTDSAHYTGFRCRDSTKEALSRLALNWMASSDPLDSDMGVGRSCRQVSSGHYKHEYTSASAFPSVFPFLDRMIRGEGLPPLPDNSDAQMDTDAKEEAPEPGQAENENEAATENVSAPESDVPVSDAANIEEQPPTSGDAENGPEAMDVDAD